MMNIFVFLYIDKATHVAQLVKHLTAMQETWVHFLGREVPLEKEMAPIPVLLPGESHGQRSLEGYRSWDRKSQTRLSTILYIDQVARVVKNLPTQAGDLRDVGSSPRLGKSLGGGHGNPLQYSCLENPMDRGAWKAAVHRITQS